MLLCAICALSTAGQRRSAKYLSYIDRYKEVAVRHQQEFGIPASITLAQGLLESAAGTSYLSTRGNNHFGIKCHNTWKGEAVTYEDTLKHDCYRKYGKAEDSFLDHARFLKGKRYSRLYDLDVTDYAGWAQGLLDCGYAEDPNYPSKLVGIIEQYELQNLDAGQPIVASRRQLSPDPSIGHDPDPDATPEDEVMRDPASLHTVHQRWGLHFVVARQGDTYLAIASEFDIKPKKLLDYNDAAPSDRLAHGETVWLEKKEGKAPLGYEEHVVKSGETPRSIAQHYGIKLKNLMKMNHLDAHSRLSAGDTLRLR